MGGGGGIVRCSVLIFRKKGKQWDQFARVLQCSLEEMFGDDSTLCFFCPFSRFVGELGEARVDVLSHGWIY